MKVLALDPANSTGYAICEVNGIDMDIYRYGCIEVDISSPFQGDHSIDLMNQVKIIIEEEQIDQVCIEDYFFSQRFANGSNVNAAYRTALHIMCRQIGISYEILNISLWKKYVVGRSTPTKEQKLKWGKECAKKLHVQQALWDRYGIRFCNYALSSKTGKPILPKSDQVDAVAQAIFYCGIFLKVQNVICSVIVPPDVEFKKKSKKMFIYE